MKKRSTIVLIFFLQLILSIGLNAQDYKFHKVYFYNFTKYIQWPENFNENEFVIAVAGETSLMASLEDMAATKSTANLQFKIISVNLNQRSLPKINILYIPSDLTNDLVKWKSKLVNEPTLIVTELDGAGKRGSMINFVEDGGRLKFEINKKEMESVGLKIANELIRFGIEI